MSDARARAARLKRILKVEGQKRLLEEWRLSHLKQEKARIDRDDVDLLASLGAQSSLHGFFIEAKVKTLRRNDVERRENLKRQETTEHRIAEARRSEKGVERLREDALRIDAAEAEASALEQSLDGHLARARTSLE